MSVLAWIVWAGGVLYVAGALPGVRRNWRGELEPAATLAGWPWGDALWRGAVRAMPVGVAGVTLLLATVPLILETSGATTLRAIGLACGALMLATWCVMGSIALFARPRALIAPQLREQPGAVGEWLGRRRAEHS